MACDGDTVAQREIAWAFYEYDDVVFPKPEDVDDDNVDDTF